MCALQVSFRLRRLLAGWWCIVWLYALIVLLRECHVNVTTLHLSHILFGLPIVTRCLQLLFSAMLCFISLHLLFFSLLANYTLKWKLKYVPASSSSWLYLLYNVVALLPCLVSCLSIVSLLATLSPV